MIHTLVHASWLNQIETVLSVLQRHRPAFKWRFTTADLDDLLAGIDRHQQN